MEIDRQPGALEREQELVELITDAAFRGSVGKLRNGGFEPRQRPPDGDARMLRHVPIIGTNRVEFAFELPLPGSARFFTASRLMSRSR